MTDESEPVYRAVIVFQKLNLNQDKEIVYSRPYDKPGKAKAYITRTEKEIAKWGNGSYRRLIETYVEVLKPVEKLNLRLY